MQKNSVKLGLPSLLKKTPFLFILFALSISPALAACHTVTPSGSGSQTGADWNNAFAGLPSTLVRGDIYYLADGTYGANYTFSQAASGTTTVEIRKAQSYDNCTSTGWNTSTMGSAQAVFPRIFTISAPYLILNGNGTQTTPGCGGAPGATVSSAPPKPTDCGIKIDDSTCSSSCIGAMRSSGSASNYTIEYVELNANSTPSANEDNFFFGTSNGGYATWNHIYGHNTGAVYLQYDCNNRTVEHSYFWGTEVQGVLDDGEHGQASFCSGNNSNGLDYSNVYRDITGTAVYTFANPGSGTNTGWEFYDNVYWNSTTFTPGGGLSFGTTTNGIIACINSGVVCNGFTFAQNTSINQGYAPGMDIDDTAGGGSMTVENNIWYQSTGTSGTPSCPNFVGNATFTENYNSFLNSGTGCGSGSQDLTNNSSPLPVTSWTTGVFTLASDGVNWNNRLALSSPYTIDAAGNTFTTDRGAYQFVSSSVGAPVNLNGSATPQ
jgi:hypothetical protein